MVLPIVFLYVDFFVPLVFLVLIVGVIGVFFLMVLFELKYKVYVDYAALEGVEVFFFF